MIPHAGGSVTEFEFLRSICNNERIVFLPLNFDSPLVTQQYQTVLERMTSCVKDTIGTYNEHSIIIGASLGALLAYRIICELLKQDCCFDLPQLVLISPAYIPPVGKFFLRQFSRRHLDIASPSSDTKGKISYRADISILFDAWKERFVLIPCDVTIIMGREDISKKYFKSIFKKYCSGTVQYKYCSGDHFFFLNNRIALIEVLKQCIFNNYDHIG